MLCAWRTCFRQGNFSLKWFKLMFEREALKRGVTESELLMDIIRFAQRHGREDWWEPKAQEAAFQERDREALRRAKG